MKIALDYRKLHLRFVCGIGFALFILRKKLKKQHPDDAEKLKAVGKQIKKLVKDYKRKCGAFNFVEIVSEGARITIRA